jgi:hypothetical protein
VGTVGRKTNVTTRKQLGDYRFSRPIARSAPERRTFKGRVYHSIIERIRATELELVLRDGQIVAWFPQVPVDLGEDFTTRIDFLVVGIDRVWCEEIKAVDSADFRRIRRLWAKYGPLPLAVLWSDKKAVGGWRIEKVDAGYAPGTVELPDQGAMLWTQPKSA